MSGRIYESINSGWRFRKGIDFPAMLENKIHLPNTEGWERVDIPHTWNASDCTGTDDVSGKCSEGYYRGTGCYVRNIVLPNERYFGRRVFIEFAGANTVAALFVNGIFAGSHKGGYSAFRFDITELVDVGAENMLTVFVSNEPSEYIPPLYDCGDFTKMGGIYRGVRLISTDKLHIDLMDSAASGVYITAVPNGGSASVHTRVRITNAGSEACRTTMRAEIIGGQLHEYRETELIVSSGTTETVLEMTIPDPILWNGVCQPFLYTMNVSLLYGSEAVDSVTEHFGIRGFSFDSEKGFFLNGRHTPLHGVNYHQDADITGWAMSDRQRQQDYSMMRDMGCNAVRMAHYQHADEEYSLCDRLGLCVWTEIGIIGKLCSGENEEPKLSAEFRENAFQQLRELVLQTYNHPSVILYGMSNEIYQMSDDIFDFYEEMYDYIRQNGGNRAAVYADAQFWGRFPQLPADAVGYNRYFGWYKEAGPVEQFGEWFDKVHTTSMKRPLCISEYGGGGAISQHKDNVDWMTDIDPCGERHYENYQAELHEQIWAQIGHRNYLWGKFVWCMFDFPSAGRKEGDTIGINDKGLCTRSRIPKDAYWFYRSVWSSEKMCHITDKRFEIRSELVPIVKAYSNADTAELFLNGKSLGSGSHHDSRLDTVFVWNNIRLQKGKNELLVRAVFADGSTAEDTVVWIC